MTLFPAGPLPTLSPLTPLSPVPARFPLHRPSPSAPSAHHLSPPCCLRRTAYAKSDSRVSSELPSSGLLRPPTFPSRHCTHPQAKNGKHTGRPEHQPDQNYDPISGIKQSFPRNRETVRTR